jgi:hypothetical protein
MTMNDGTPWAHQTEHPDVEDASGRVYVCDGSGGWRPADDLNATPMTFGALTQQVGSVWVVHYKK